jgi:hypothetical protein
MNEKHGFDSFLWHESRAPPTLPQYDIHRLGWGLIDTLFGDDRIEETDLALRESGFHAGLPNDHKLWSLECRNVL